MTEKQSIQAQSGATLVIGGTGKIGRRVVSRLRTLGVETRIGSRSGKPAFDWHDRSTWRAALEGVTKVYVAYLPDLVIPGAEESIRDFVSTAVEQGVERLVLLSGRGEEEGYGCERIVQESGVEWTIVRVAWFMQNFSEGDFCQMIVDGAIAVPASDIPEPFVDVNDIAEVVAAALTEAGHAGELYEVTGPRSLTFADLAREVSIATGRDVPFIRVPEEAFARALSESGAPDDIVWLMGYLFGTVLDGRNAKLGDGVQRALGREPADFQGFARRAAARGTWNTAAEDAA